MNANTSQYSIEKSYLDKKPADYSWTEPISAYCALYPNNNATVTESGHFFELDDSLDAERVRLQHRTGTFFEMQPNGDEVHKIFGDGYEIVTKNKNVLIKGVCNVTVEGDAVLHVVGDSYTQIDGNSQIKVAKDLNVVVEGAATISSKGDIDILAGGATGDITLFAPNAVNVRGDLNVSGGITSGSSITAQYNVTAGWKVFGTGGLETLGGINVGFTTPGPTITTGTVTALLSVKAPFISGLCQVDGLIVRDAKGPMEMIRQIHNTHIHPVAYGPTGTPFSKM